MRADPRDNRWVGLAVLAEALAVGEKQARKIAVQEGIRTTRTRPAEYHWGDIVTTSNRRKGQSTMSITVPYQNHARGRVVGLATDKAIVLIGAVRVLAPWLEQKPALDDMVNVQGTSSTGATWTWMITGPATAPDTFADVEPTSMIGKVRARIYREALREAHGIVVRRGGSYEASIDILARAAEIEQEAGIA